MGTDFLFVSPSFSRGVASVADFWGVLREYNVSPSPEYADAMAIYSDFCMVGQDIARATQQVAHQQSQLELFPLNPAA